MRLTGDPQADADIMAFVKARQNILQQGISFYSWKDFLKVLFTVLMIPL